MSTANDLTPEELAAYNARQGANQPGTAPKVTPADIEAQIVAEHYYTAAEGVDGHDLAQLRAKEPAKAWAMVPLVEDPDLSRTQMAPLLLLTHCVLVLRNGFTVTGESACASPENFDAEKGREIARAAAVAKCWPLLGFALRNELTGQRPMSTRPVLDMDKLTKLDTWPKTTDGVVIIDRRLVHRPHDFSYVAEVTGQRRNLCHVERVDLQKPVGLSREEHQVLVDEATAKAIDKVHAWFATHDDDGNALDNDRQQDA